MLPVDAPPLGVVHVPPGSGPPPKEVARFVIAPELHKLIGAPTPGFAAVVVVTVTVALLVMQGATPMIV